jgi:hypothetical protein
VEKEAETSILFLTDYSAGFRIDKMHVAARRASDRFISLIALIRVIDCCKALHIQSGMWAAENESGHSTAFYFSGLKT